MPYQSDPVVGFMTSSYISNAKATNITLFQRLLRRIYTLSFSGCHESTTVKVCLDITSRFPAIQVLIHKNSPAT